MRWRIVWLFLAVIPWTVRSVGSPVVVPEEPRIERLDPALDAVLDPESSIRTLASGFRWSEGPVWVGKRLLFSDVPTNTIHVWEEGVEGAAVFLNPSGGKEGKGVQGSNGLALDASGRLLLCQHGARQLARRETDGTFTVLADRFEGRRFNSPNDLVVARDGMIYFTDPPYGLGRDVEPELDFHGIYALAPDGRIHLLDRSVRFPNGIALGPDGRTLYVAVSDPDAPRILVYPLGGDGLTAGPSRVFFDAGPLKAEGRNGSCDGLKIDEGGRFWATGPGGVLVLDANGRHLGSIRTGGLAANVAFGGREGKDLFVTAHQRVLVVSTRVRGLAVVP